MDLNSHITAIKDFPQKGIIFRDITTLLQNKEAFSYAIDKMAEFAKSVNADVIVGPESRGFIFGTPIAYKLNVGFVPVRKPNKLPRKTIEINYDLEYGSNTLCIHEDSIQKGQRVVIVDDLLATGGTVQAAIKLIEQLGGEVVGLSFLIELDALNGKEKLKGYKVNSLLHY